MRPKSMRGHAACDILTPQNQRESPLLCLPAELRNIIYSYLFDGHIITVCRLYACPRCNGFKRRPFQHCAPEHFALTSTCRQIYKEARLLPIASSIFCGHTIDLAFLFDHYLNKAQCGAVTTVCIPIDFAIESMGLKRLRGLKRIIVTSRSLKSFPRSSERKRIALLQGSAWEMEGLEDVVMETMDDDALKRLGLDANMLPK